MSTSSSTTSSPGPAPPPGLELPPIEPQMVKVSQRPTLSCTECSRKKTKCDKTIPCQNCKKRGKSHLCSVPMHVKPIAKSRKRTVASPAPIPPAPLLTPPATTSNLPLDLPLPNPPPNQSIDPSVLSPLYTEINQLRAVVDSLQSRVHGLEGALSFFFAQAQTHPHSTDSIARPTGGGHREEDTMMSQGPSPPPQGYSFYPPYPAFYPLHPPHFPFPSTAHPLEPQHPSSLSESFDQLLPTSRPPSTALRLTNLSSHPPQFPLPNPTIPSSSQTFNSTDQRSTDGGTVRIDARGREAMTGQRFDENRRPIERRGSSSLEKLLSPTMTGRGE